MKAHTVLASQSARSLPPRARLFLGSSVKPLPLHHLSLSGGILGILLDRISCKPDGGSAGRARRIILTQTGRSQGARWAGRIAAAQAPACARAHILGPLACTQRRCGGSQGKFYATSRRDGGLPPPARPHARRLDDACLKHFQQPAPAGRSLLTGWGIVRPQAPASVAGAAERARQAQRRGGPFSVPNTHSSTIAHNEGALESDRLGKPPGEAAIFCSLRAPGSHRGCT